MDVVVAIFHTKNNHLPFANSIDHRKNGYASPNGDASLASHVYQILTDGMRPLGEGASQRLLRDAAVDSISQVVQWLLQNSLDAGADEVCTINPHKHIKIITSTGDSAPQRRSQRHIGGQRLRYCQG